MNAVVEEIISEVEKLDELEQQILLTKLRVRQMKLHGVKPAANSPSSLQPLTMEEISKYTHEVRKQQYKGK